MQEIIIVFANFIDFIEKIRFPAKSTVASHSNFLPGNRLFQCFQVLGTT